MLLCNVKSRIMALGNVSCQKPPLRMEFSWISVLPKSLFQSDGKCEAIDISLCTDAPSPPKKKKNIGDSDFFWGERGGGGASVHRLIDMILMQIGESLWNSKMAVYFREFWSLINVPREKKPSLRTQTYFRSSLFFTRKVTFRVKRSDAFAG